MEEEGQSTRAQLDQSRSKKRPLPEPTEWQLFANVSAIQFCSLLACHNLKFLRPSFTHSGFRRFIVCNDAAKPKSASLVTTHQGQLHTHHNNTFGF